MFKVIPFLTLVLSATAWSAELTIKVANIKHEGVYTPLFTTIRKSLSRTKAITVSNDLG